MYQELSEQSTWKTTGITEDHEHWNKNNWQRSIPSVASHNRFNGTDFGFSQFKGNPNHSQQYFNGVENKKQHKNNRQEKFVNNSCSSTCTQLFRNFCSQTSLHGLKFVGNYESHLLERLFWSIAFASALLVAAYYIYQVYSKWMETPVIVSIGARTTPMVEIPFPAITICTMNEVRKSNAVRILNSTKLEDELLKKMLMEYCGKNKTDIVKSQKLKGDWETYRKYMTIMRQPCHEMILSCYYGGLVYNCTDIFNPTLSDEGICCAFNNVKRDFMYRNPLDLSDMNVTFPIPSVDWTPETGFPAGTTNDSIPWRPRGSGSQLGLTIVLNVEEQEFYCSTSASKGFKMLLHSPVEAPKIADYGSMISAAREYRIKIRPIIMNYSESLRNTKEVDRQCTFDTGTNLLYFRTYTQRNCILECESLYTLDVCHCVPYYLPKNADTPICGKENEECTLKAKKILEMMMVDSSITIEGNWSKPNCYCLPGCSELSYKITMTYGQLEPEFAARRNYLPSGYLINSNRSRRDLAVIHLFFTETQFLNYYKSELIGVSDFLSSTGGLLGVFLGFSFISAVEILYFSTVRLGIKLFHSRHNTINHASSDIIRKFTH